MSAWLLVGGCVLGWQADEEAVCDYRDFTGPDTLQWDDPDCADAPILSPDPSEGLLKYCSCLVVDGNACPPPDPEADWGEGRCGGAWHVVGDVRCQAGPDDDGTCCYVAEVVVDVPGACDE